jgi:hypothetical protein
VELADPDRTFPFQHVHRFVLVMVDVWRYSRKTGRYRHLLEGIGTRVSSSVAFVTKV